MVMRVAAGAKGAWPNGGNPPGVYLAGTQSERLRDNGPEDFPRRNIGFHSFDMDLTHRGARFRGAADSDELSALLAK